MNNQNNGLKRDTIDKFYTIDSVVELCINTIKSSISINKKDLIIEPSAGGGAFIKYLKLLTKKQIFLDIAPQHKDIIKQDYLTFDPLTLEDINVTNNSKIHVVGNPPFGRQSSLAKKFIKKSSEFAQSISFILPKSFKKNSFKNTFPLHFHLITEFDLPTNSFMINDKEYDVPCVFQIWEKRNYEREIEIKEDPKGYIFVKKNEDPDISFRRVGVYAGKVDTLIENKSPQSHYFIKFNKETDIDITLLQNLVFDTDNTVGPRSISKPELIKEFNKFNK